MTRTIPSGYWKHNALNYVVGEESPDKQPEAGINSVRSTQRAVDSTTSILKRKRDEWFDISDSEFAVTTSTVSTSSASSSKLLKTDDSGSGFSSRSDLRQSHTELFGPHVIADHPRFHSIFKGAPIGFWWEIARLLCNSTVVGDIPIGELRKYVSKTNAEAAPAVSHTIERKPANASLQNFTRALEQEKAARMPWIELDHEEQHEENAMRMADPSLVYFQDRSEGWYGGKVHFTAKLVRNLSDYSLVLEQPYLGSSNRFTRRFGSKRFIRVKLSDDLFYGNHQRTIQFFKRPFVVFTRVFRAFFAKDHSVFLVQTDEIPVPGLTRELYTIRASPTRAVPSFYDLAFLDFVNWHNPPGLNTGQPMAKWASRFALGLSNSVPGIQVAKEDLIIIDDIVADSYIGKTEVPAECTMTDGCGLANGDFFAALIETSSLEWRIYPTAIQVRINGAKGLLTIHPEHTSPTPEKRPRVWIRKSQQKIVYPAADTDVAHYTVDILRHARMSTPAQLSTETIINLAENGVPTETFAAMMRESFQSKVDRLSIWDGPNGLFKLWKSVCQEGHVIAARLARENAGSARAKGYIYEDLDETVDVDCMEEDGVVEDGRRVTMEKSTAWWEDPISGQPSSLEETCAGLLDAGFNPSTCELLREKLMKVAEKAIVSLRNKYHIKIPLSCTAFVVPDPLGVLEPGQCQIKFSSHKVKGADGIPTDMILGPVLLTRHPCKVPSDIQKAVGVFRHELRYFVDVIVVSTRGHVVNGEKLNRHLASMTGGGDYDGDLMSAFWEPKLLENFRCADPRFADEPETVSRCLHKSHVYVRDFLREKSDDLKISDLQSYLLAPLKNTSMVGKYSKFWENSIYTNGYSHEETVRLAYIFCAILDGTKTGVSVRDEILQGDTRNYDKPPPAWKNATSDFKGQPRLSTSNMSPIKRMRDQSPFIMDILQEEIKQESRKQRKVIKERLGAVRIQPDEDLQQPWTEFLEKVALEASHSHSQTAGGPESDPPVLYLARMKSAIEDHVNGVYENEWTEWRSQTSQTDSRSKGKGKAAFTDLSIVKRQDILRSVSLKFHSNPDPNATWMHDEEAIARLKASYAYILGCKKSKPRFPFDVAYRSLCKIKAQAISNNTEKTITSAFYSRMDLHKSWLDDD
ncbi:RNA dependent RNA polymerase-domain-containing protein [Irpex rosettiformis]|uniref:RNA dependent RNA polymerase-domain-containing protein n=1 Tax=Irpex rosettiformis TaxID=378272 RepID=A0ACB8U6K1_9APHY|nr:RNA dependent RNA polymerase-domain-containing protein [Irpex rosettiformis]